mmetsp:Transcript_6574/g.17084  ORF Transcript_6574/g.17084 Transcript_6574/m.17084 type:complete len:244 (-) Transcript_6574:88-819(-)
MYSPPHLLCTSPSRIRAAPACAAARGQASASANGSEFAPPCRFRLPRAHLGCRSWPRRAEVSRLRIDVAKTAPPLPPAKGPIAPSPARGAESDADGGSGAADTGSPETELADTESDCAWITRVKPPSTLCTKRCGRARGLVPPPATCGVARPSVARSSSPNAIQFLSKGTEPSSLGGSRRRTALALALPSCPAAAASRGSESKDCHITRREPGPSPVVAQPSPARATGARASNVRRSRCDCPP